MNSINFLKRSSSRETKSLDRSREKILHCYSERNSLGFKVLDHNFTTSPFQATLFWNDLVNHFRTHIQIKQKRVRFRSYDSCFSGSEAVNLVYNYLLKPKHQTNSRPISRDNALKVCKLLHKTQVIQPVNLSKPEFEDNSSKLYRISAASNASWLEAYHSNTMPQKPQTEIMRPKTEHNLQDKASSFKCSAFSERNDADRTLNLPEPKITNLSYNQNRARCSLEKNENSLKSTSFSVRDKKSICRKFIMKKPLLSFNLFHKSNKDHLSDDDDDGDDSIVKNGKLSADNGSKKSSKDCRAPPALANHHAHSSSDYSSSISSLPGSSFSHPSSYSSLSMATGSSSSPPMLSSSLSMHSISLDDVRISGLERLDDGDDDLIHPVDISQSDLSHDINDTTRQIILSRLLKTIDLPFIESLVHPIRNEISRSTTLPLKVQPQATISEEYCHLLLNRAMKDPSIDSEEIWWSTAIKLLNLLSEMRSHSPAPHRRLWGLHLNPKKRDWLSGFSCLEDRKSEATMKDESIKSRIFSTIVAEHRSMSQCLWFSSKDDRRPVEMSRLIASGKSTEALLASQLSFQLLPWKRKDHVIHLLLFMRLCKMDASFDCQTMLVNRLLSTTINNRARGKLSLEDCFEGCIIKEGLLPASQSCRLLTFLVDRVEHLCRLSSDVKNEISKAVKMKSFDEEYVPETCVLCSQHLNLSEYEEEGRSYTEDALARLVDRIIDSTRYSLKEKKKLLRQVRKHHPHVYEKYFDEVF